MSSLHRFVPPTERFWARVYPAPSGCWVWVGELTAEGYGRMKVDSVRVSAHRFSYELVCGPIPDGLGLDHLCRVRRCVNPLHLQPTTSQVNTLRGVGVSARNAKKVRCHNGHEFTPENTYLSKTGRRHCRTCQRERTRRRRALEPPTPERTHCRRGHEFTPENTYIAKDGNRRCRACMVRRAREYQARQRALPKDRRPWTPDSLGEEIARMGYSGGVWIGGDQ